MELVESQVEEDALIHEAVLVDPVHGLALAIICLYSKMRFNILAETIHNRFRKHWSKMDLKYLLDSPKNNDINLVILANIDAAMHFSGLVLHRISSIPR